MTQVGSRFGVVTTQFPHLSPEHIFTAQASEQDAVRAWIAKNGGDPERAGNGLRANGALDRGAHYGGSPVGDQPCPICGSFGCAGC